MFIMFTLISICRCTDTHIYFMVKTIPYKKTRPGYLNKEGTQFYIISILRQSTCQTVEKRFMLK